MDQSKIWLNLALFTGFGVHSFLNAWRHRPGRSNRQAQLSAFCNDVGFFLGALLLIWADVLQLEGRKGPMIWLAASALVLPACIASSLWKHFDDLQRKWRDRQEAPDPDQFPTETWRWMATLSGTVFAFMAVVAWLNHDSGLAVLAGLIAFPFVISILVWIAGRLDLYLIRRIQRQQSPGTAAS